MFDPTKPYSRSGGGEMSKLCMWLAWKLPKKLVYYCAIRLIAHATTGKYSNQNVPELTAIDALKRWEGPR